MSSSIFDLIILGGGLYLLWGALSMKLKNTVPKMLLSKSMEISKDQDMSEFTKAMLLPTLIMGIFALLSGGLGMATHYVVGLETIQLIVMMITFLMLLAYGYITVRYQKKYLGN
ncbi:MAG: hypothetical protein RRX92_04925 [Lachnospiraceae bacterium]